MCGFFSQQKILWNNQNTIRFQQLWSISPAEQAADPVIITSTPLLSSSNCSGGTLKNTLWARVQCYHGAARSTVTSSLFLTHFIHIHGQGQDKVIDMCRYEWRSFDKKEAYPIVSKDDTFFIFFTSYTFLMVNKNVSSNLKCRIIPQRSGTLISDWLAGFVFHITHTYEVNLVKKV